MHAGRPTRVFYGWWIVLAAFLNLFFSVGIIYYGFPVFYPSLVSSLGFTRAQLILGFLLGFLVAAAVLGFLAGVMIDRWGVRPRSEEHTSELQSRLHLVCRLLLEKKKKTRA